MKTMTLDVSLTPDEIREYGKQLARHQMVAQRLEDQKKAAADQFKAQISTEESEIGRLARIVDTGVEYRDVEVNDVPDYEAGMVRIVRLDTGEAFRSRPMLDEERQQELPMDPVAAFEKAVDDIVAAAAAPAPAKFPTVDKRGPKPFRGAK
jgi:hypothetical protein